MKEKQVYNKIWPLPVRNFKKFFLWHQAVHIMNLTVDRQDCVIKTVAVRLRTDTQTDTHTGTDKSLKTEGPKTLSNNIFYFRNVTIGGPIKRRNDIALKANIYLKKKTYTSG